MNSWEKYAVAGLWHISCQLWRRHAKIYARSVSKVMFSDPMGKIFDRRMKCCCWSKIQWFIHEKHGSENKPRPGNLRTTWIKSPHWVSARWLYYVFLRWMGSKKKPKYYMVACVVELKWRRLFSIWLLKKTKDQEESPTLTPGKKQNLVLPLCSWWKTNSLNKDQWKDINMHKEKRVYT